MKTVSSAELLHLTASRQKVSVGDLGKRYQMRRTAVNKRPATNLPAKPLHSTYEPQPGELDVGKMEFK